MGDSVTPEVEVLSNMIRQYFSQERSEEETIRALNHLRRVLHEVSPFAQEPVDCVLWVKADEVVANDYNPNVMSSSEKKLLKHSLEQDGFTQPVVVSEEKEHYLVVDGFHRQLLGRKADTRKRLKGCCQWPVLIQRERDRHHVLPQPYGITVPGENTR